MNNFKKSFMHKTIWGNNMKVQCNENDCKNHSKDSIYCGLSIIVLERYNGQILNCQQYEYQVQCFM